LLSRLPAGTCQRASDEQPRDDDGRNPGTAATRNDLPRAIISADIPEEDHLNVLSVAD
jgi:hypothetical protein